MGDHRRTLPLFETIRLLLALSPLASTHQQPGRGMVQRRDVLGGLIHDYSREAA